MKPQAMTMAAARRFTVIGLMSGTSMDGIDAAILETDGDAVLLAGPQGGIPYPDELRRTLLRLPCADLDLVAIEHTVTDLHAEAVRRLCAQANREVGGIDLIGFHGQTIQHDPEHRRTWQLGDGQRLADTLGRVVINQFRQNDLEHGGQGAPLAPAYHRALVRASGLSGPVAVLNIGGVSNVTLIDEDRIHACDCGPGNALIDDWVSRQFNIPYDAGGRRAAAGVIDTTALATLLQSPYFLKHGPKSLDRNAFSPAPVSGLSGEDGAATLTAFTAAAIALEAQRLPRQPGLWIVVGGGRLNLCLLDALRARLGAPVKTAEEVGWSGDAIEAQAFGYLAVRSALQWPLSWPDTTGVAAPVTGGVRWEPKARAPVMGT
ncbi:MAG TPA: anhydro-N-acetylmuramic acid kinase [Steroidobacteraceae bacterium]|jgi:anhydro-N-acetylmuramic acid kinase|nr:anhydro-N-acetylmuramic acid kinase [Steroidobacteraceae bacterium]